MAPKVTGVLKGGVGKAGGRAGPQSSGAGLSGLSTASPCPGEASASSGPGVKARPWLSPLSSLSLSDGASKQHSDGGADGKEAETGKTKIQR